MMFAHQITCAAFHFVIWIAPTEKFVYKSSTYIYLCTNWTPIIACVNWIKRYLTLDKKLNSVDTCARSNHWYFRAQPPADICSIKTEATIRTKWSNTLICSRKVMIFAKLRKNRKLTVLNMGYKLDLLQPKQEVFWHLTYSRSETNNAWKIQLEVMKFVYLHPTYVLSVLVIGLNITWPNSSFCEFARDLHPICTLSQLKTWLALSYEIRAKRLNIWVHSLSLFGMKKSPVIKGYGYDTLQPGQVLSSTHFCHQAPSQMLSRRRF